MKIKLLFTHIFMLISLELIFLEMQILFIKYSNQIIMRKSWKIYLMKWIYQKMRMKPKIFNKIRSLFMKRKKFK